MTDIGIFRGTQVPEPRPALAHLAAQGRLLGARVLLVDDNPVNQEVALLLLRSAGVVVEVAQDGQFALEMLYRKPYDLVLMDVQMPRMDGLQATRLLRQDPAFQQLPVVALTANAMPKDRQACLEAGMNDHLAKPVDPGLLYATLVHWLAMGGVLAKADLPATALPADVAPAPAAARSADQQLAGMAQLVNLDQAKEYCGGNAQLLRTIMARFAEHYTGAGNTLLALVQAGDLPAVAHLLHSLGGASASVGAGQLSALAQQMEAAAKQGQPVQALLPMGQALAGALDALLAGMAANLVD